MGRMVKRLSNLEIDEVSLVDRPANQHGLVAIAKADQEKDMPQNALFDAKGDEVYEDELQPGDFVYDETGQEFQVAEGGDEDEDGAEDGADEGGEDDEVGKAGGFGNLARDAAGRGSAFARRKASSYGTAASMEGRALRRAASERARGARQGAEQHVRRNRVRYAAGAAGVGGLGVGYGSGRVGKSLGDQVLEELSKAYTDDDRDQVIAKAMGRIEEVAKRNEQLEEAMVTLIEDRDATMFREVAKSYELGDEDELGGLLLRASQVMDEDDVALLDRIFSSAGEIQKSYFEEVGIIGGGESTILDQVYGMATEVVAKGAESGLTQEQAVTAMFDANPDAYDAYEAETRLRG